MEIGIEERELPVDSGMSGVSDGAAGSRQLPIRARGLESSPRTPELSSRSRKSPRLRRGMEEQQLPGDSGMSGMSGMSDGGEDSRQLPASSLDLSFVSSSRSKDSSRARGPESSRQESSRKGRDTGRRRENRYAHDSGKARAQAEAGTSLPGFASMEHSSRADRLLRLQILKDLSDVFEQRMRFHRAELAKDFQGEFGRLKDICDNIKCDIHAVRSQLTHVEQQEEQFMAEQEKNRLKLQGSLDAFKDMVVSGNDDGDEAVFTNVLGQGLRKPEQAQRRLINGNAPREPEPHETFLPSLHADTAQSLDANDESEKAPPPKPALLAFVEGSLFGSLSSLVIMTNTVHIAISTEVAMVCTRTAPGTGTGCSDSSVLTVMNYCFFAFYLLEALLKAAVQGSDFVHGEERWWNFFDAVLVLSGVIDIVEDMLAMDSGLANLTWLRLLRLLKLMKMFRVVRTMRAFKELRFILSSLIHAVMITFWALVAMGSIMFFFSLCFLQGLAGYLGATALTDIAPEVLVTLDRRFGNLSTSMETLFLAITGGLLWDELGDCLSAAGTFYYWLLVLFVGFTTFAILNVINGICCTAANEVHQNDYESIVEELVEKNNQLLQSLKEELKNLDTNGDGMVSLTELESLAEDKRVVDFLAALDITWEDSLRLFKLLQASHGTQKVPVDDFIDSCVKLKGAAKSIDVVCLLSLVGKLTAEQRRQTKDVMECLASLRADLTTPESAAKARNSIKLRAPPASSNGAVTNM